MRLFVLLGLTREFVFSTLLSRNNPFVSDRFITKRYSTISETPIYGRDGIPLDQVRPEAYLSLMPCHMPNMFLFPGPDAGAPSTTTLAEARCEYMVKCVQKLQRDRLRSMTPTVAARDDFVRQAGVGSLRSLDRVLKGYENPRWEDFEYEAFPGDEGRFG